MTFQHFKLDLDADGIALVTWNSPGRSMNVIDLKVIEELGAIVDEVAADAAIKAAVITSGKETFCAGADLAMLETSGRQFADMVTARGEEAALAWFLEESRKLSALCRRTEPGDRRWAAAISATALGGGFELCLACHYRIATDNEKA